MQSTVWILLKPRLLSARNGLKPNEQNGNRSRLVLFSLIGVTFWAGAFAIFYRVLRYFQNVQDFGDILAMKLLSMMIITFFTLLLFSSIINSLSHMYLSRDLSLLHSMPVGVGIRSCRAGWAARSILPGWW